MSDLQPRPLTPTERAVLAYLCMTTMSQKEIAEALKVSPKTVNLHAGMVYKKCGVFGRVGLILKVTAEHS